jgi:hypothetical protein
MEPILDNLKTKFLILTVLAIGFAAEVLVHFEEEKATQIPIYFQAINELFSLNFQSLEQEKESLAKQNHLLKEVADGNSTSRVREKQQLRTVQEEIGSKINDLYGLSDELAEMLQH